MNQRTSHPKGHVTDSFLNKRDQNMIPNSIGLFSSNTKEKKLKDPQAMITIFNRSTWRPMAVTALKTNIVSYHQRDSNNKRTSFCPDTSTMLPTLLNKRDLYMAPNSIGAFLFNIVRENRNPQPCLLTLSQFSTCRPNVVIAKLLRFRNPQSQAKSKITSLDFPNTYWLHKRLCYRLLVDSQHGAPNVVVANTATQH